MIIKLSGTLEVTVVSFVYRILEKQRKVLSKLFPILAV